jgi:hypothetical protein
MSGTPRRRLLSAAIAAVLLVPLAACGDNAGDTPAVDSTNPWS